MSAVKTILYIEDNQDNRTLVRRLLKASGYQMVEAPTAQAAMEYLQANVPDLILMDINMPDIDGYTLTHQIKNRPALAHTPIIAITANVMKGDREKSLSSGCDDYIEKPIDVDRFISQIESYLK
ncbi:MAG: response regulator [Anaerolineaceae bacterium]|jgi:two-component system cell cycle response regulator DivK|nr:response regulator [Anaerolineaceae bacterium]